MYEFHLFWSNVPFAFFTLTPFFTLVPLGMSFAFPKSPLAFGVCCGWLPSLRSCLVVASRALYLSFSVPTLPAAVQSVWPLSMVSHQTYCWDKTHAQNISLTRAKGRGWEGGFVSKPTTQAWGPEFGSPAHKNRAWWFVPVIPEMGRWRRADPKTCHLQPAQSVSVLQCLQE